MGTSYKTEFQNAGGETLAGRLEEPRGPRRATALFAHCFTCSKDIAAATRISRELSERGIAVLRFDFTGLGHSEGEFANTNFSSNTEDLVSAADHLRARGHAPTLLVGHSLGGAAVLRAAASIPEVKAVATIGAPAEPEHVKKLFRSEIEEIESAGCATVDLAGRQFQIKKQFLDDLNEHRLLDGLRNLRVATAIFHSPIDNIVGIDNAGKIYQALLHPKSFITLDDADHLLTRAADAEYVASVLAAWADRYLPAGEAERTATAAGEVHVEQDRGGFLTHVTAGNHRLLADEPRSVGGGDRGPNPYDFLLTALGTCTSMTLHMYAKHKGWPLQNVSMQLRHRRIHAEDCADCESESGRIDQIEREITVEGPLDDAQKRRLAEIADRCPVHRTLMNEKKIRTRLV